MMKRTFGTMSALVLMAGASLGFSMPASAAAATNADAARPATTDRIIIKTVGGRTARASVSKGTAQATAQESAASVGVDTAARVVSQVTPTTTVIQVDPDLTQAEFDLLIEEINADPRVIYAEPDIRVYPTVTLPNDPYLSSPYNQWGLWQGLDSGDGGFSSRAPGAWGTSTGNGVVVGVIDTGITSHPDLDAQVVAGYDFISTSAIANDGNGRDSDPSDPGDWISLDDSNGLTYGGYFTGCTPTNSTWHGTHVAGTIGALTDNSTGVAAVAPNVKIQPLRVLGKCGGYPADIAAAIIWGSGGSVPGIPPNTTPAEVLNLSLGGSGSCDSTTQAAINTAIANGTTIVVAAGNSSSNASGFYPANCNNVITVASHTDNGQRSWFSNYGSTVEISGPGSGIWSTVNSGTTGPASPSYNSYSGTSMATPHVAGVAALLMAADPSLTPAQVLTTIQATAQPFAAGSSCIGLCGAGYVDAQAALNSLGPQAPAALTVIADYEALSAHWTAPVAGLTPTHYDVGLSSDSGVTWTDDSTATTSIDYTSLSPATSYLIRVRAATADDSSAWVTSGATNPLMPTTPQAITALATVVNDSALQVSWTAPTDTGGRPIIEYQVAHSIDDSTWVTDDTTATTNTTVGGLANGTAYKVRITPTNVLGAGVSVTTGWVTPRTPSAPTAPLNINVEVGDGSLTLTWAAPADDGGRTINGYIAQISTDDSTWTTHPGPLSASATFAGLANGTSYSVRVAATNTIGTGTWATSTGTPTAPPAPVPAPAPAPAPAPPPAPVITPPGAPSILQAVASNGSVTVDWLPSDDTGGEAPTEFTVELDGPSGVEERSTTATSAELTDLTNGATYRIRIAATNSAGTGDFSAWSEDLVPVSVPTAPTWVSGEALSGAVTLAWSPPDDTGGTSITDYVVKWFADGKEVALTSDDTELTVSGLSNGVRYDFRIAAQNAAGVGAWSTPFVLTPRGEPVSEPRDVGLQKRKLRVTATWQAPSVGEVTRYVVAVSINGKAFRTKRTTAGQSARFSISRQTKSVAIRVLAIDSYGRGPWSKPVELVVQRKR